MTGADALAPAAEDTRAAIAAAHAQVVAPLIPAGARLWDVHAHLGADADGTEQAADALLERMAAHGIERTNVFSFAAADLAGYRAANDRVIAAAAGSGGRLVPFGRVDPDPGAPAELERALAAGARGVKLHPLRGAYGFDHPDVERAVAVAAAHRVPVLFHAGRGLDPFAADVGRLLRRHPGAPLILAHCGIGDLHELAAATDGCPGLALDTSLWNPLDAQALVASVPPERLVLGSDAPYYTPHSTIAKLVLPLRRGGASDAQVRGALWGTAERFARGEGLPTLSEPLDPGVGRIPLGCLRAHEYLLQATALVWTKQADAIGVLPLAGRALRSVDRLEAALAAELLELAARTWPVDVAHAPRREVLALSWSTFRLIDYADALAVNTPP